MNENTPIYDTNVLDTVHTSIETDDIVLYLNNIQDIQLQSLTYNMYSFYIIFLIFLYLIFSKILSYVRSLISIFF